MTLANKKIALAHDYLFEIGGAERVLKSLKEIFPQAPIYTLINNTRITRPFLGEAKIITSYLQKIPGVSQSWEWFKYFLMLMPKVWEKTDLSQYDLVVSSSAAFVKGIKTGPATRHVSYCHSPTRYLWGNKEEYLVNLPEGKFLKRILPKFLERLQVWDFNKAQAVDYFVANSKFIADKIKKNYQREAKVIYPCIRVKNFSISDKVDNYYLIVSRLRPYKKVDLAVKAFNNLKLPLKIIGQGSQLKRLKKIARSNIEFLGGLPDAKRNYYLSRCRAFIYPQVEDFGITALEAMASGRPVIAYKNGGALETVKEGISGTFFAEQTWESLAHKILRFDPGQFDPLKIREQAEQFDEAVFKDNFLSFLESL